MSRTAKTSAAFSVSWSTICCKICCKICRGGDSQARLKTADTDRLPLKWHQPPNCHCEERSDVAISGRQLRFRRGFPVIHSGTARLPRRFAPRNDTSGECGGAPAPSSGLMTPYKALTDCRYTPYFGAYRLTTADTSRRCFPEIAPQGHFLALRAQGAMAPSGPRNDKSGPVSF